MEPIEDFRLRRNVRFARRTELLLLLLIIDILGLWAISFAAGLCRSLTGAVGGHLDPLEKCAGIV